MNKIDKIALLQSNFNKVKTFENYTQIDKINKKLELLFIYHANALEGNSLSLTATQKALSGQTVGGKTIKEHLEVTNLKESLDLIKYMAEHQEKFCVPVLLEIYYTVLLRSNMKMAWLKTNDLRSKKRINNEFREVAEVSSSINEIMHWHRSVTDNSGSNINPIIVATTLFSKLLKLKPFNYENERIAKLVLNLELLKSRYPIVVIDKKYKLDFDNAVHSAIYIDDMEPLTEIITASLIKNMKMYIKATSDQRSSTNER